MYETEDDTTYCYAGTTVLKNELDLRTQEELDAFEAEITAQRASEPLPEGNLDYAHYRDVHHHLFQDVYDWAGKPRSIWIGKGGNWFCRPEHIEREMNRIFAELKKADFLRGRDVDGFAEGAAHFLADLNAIHPFREGNGRTQLSFLLMLADQAGHPLDLDKMKPGKMLDATIMSFGGDESALRSQLRFLL